MLKKELSPHKHVWILAMSMARLQRNKSPPEVDEGELSRTSERDWGWPFGAL